MGQAARYTRFAAHQTWRPYTTAAALVTIATAAGAVFLRDRVPPTDLAMLYMLTVVLTGLRWGRGAAVLSSILSVLAFDFFFVPPYYTFAVADTQYFITFSVVLVVALVVGTLTGRLRDHAAALQSRERETAALYAFSRSMVAARDLTEMAEAVVTHISANFGRPVALLLGQAQQLALHTASPGVSLDAKEYAAAMWTFKYGEPTGWGQSPMPDGPSGCVPLRTAQSIQGVLVLRHPLAGISLTPNQMRLLEACADQAGVVLERIQLADAARRAQMLEEAERLHDALLHSISHALRTPLASIIGSLSTLTDPAEERLDMVTRRDLVEAAREEAERLNWLVSNLLDMTRLESGHLRLTIDLHDIEDVIGVALGQVAGKLQERPIHVQVAQPLPLVPLDHVLIVQVLDNLLTNAIKYSPAQSPIAIWVRIVHEAVEVSVADRGVGIPVAERARIFEKFYRVERPGNVTGIGLGLAICRGIVEAHRGRIWADEREGGGTICTFALPLRGLYE